MQSKFTQLLAAFCLAFALMPLPQTVANNGKLPQNGGAVVVSVLAGDKTAPMTLRPDPAEASCKQSGYACNKNSECCSGTCEVVVCK